MKLHTSIAPRRDGTVRATGKDGSVFVFAPGTDGELSCDVTDPVLVASLLSTEQFWPADANDFDSAASLFQVPKPEQAGGGQSPKGEGEHADDDEDEPVNMNALPVEANTTPVVKPPKKVSAKTAKKAE